MRSSFQSIILIGIVMPQAPLSELILFILICASVAGFAWRLSRLLRILKAAKSDNSSAINPGRFFSEVLLQSKVITERPLAGIAHAFVFWGFCVFALITVNHIATGFGHPLLSTASAFGRFYFGVAAAFAVAVSIGIVILAVRRFLVASPAVARLGRAPSRESLRALIFILMVSYLAGLYLAPDSAASVSAWWTHTLALLIFLPLIPHTKHLHLMLSPITVFLKRPGFSDIPPLKGDEDFGLVSGKDVTRLDALQAFSCVECGRCTEHCPAYNTEKILNPKEVILGLRAYLNTESPASEKPLLGEHISQEAVFECTTCGACEFQCPVGIQHLPVIIGLRRGAVNTGAWEDSYGTKLFLTLERNGNSLGMASSERQKFIVEKKRPAVLRRNPGILPLARLHGRLRPGGARNHPLPGENSASPWHHLRRPPQRKSATVTPRAASATTCCSPRLPKKTSPPSRKPNRKNSSASVRTASAL